MAQAFARPALQAPFFKPRPTAPLQLRLRPAARPTVQRRQKIQASQVAEPAELEVKSARGESKGNASLALKVADPHVAKGLVHRYVVMYNQNKRRGTASTLTRAEVRGGGRKPYAQKGTGNARQGSKRTPLRPGGGVVFGPKPKDWKISMNKKERRLAMATALQSAAPAITVVDSLAELAEPKTRLLVSTLASLGVNPMAEKTLLILNEPTRNVMLAGGNVEKLKIDVCDCLNVYNILNADKIVIEAEALKFVQEFYGGAAAAKDDEEDDEAEEGEESGEVEGAEPVAETGEAEGAEPVAA